jgi:hypothetical protein
MIIILSSLLYQSSPLGLLIMRIRMSYRDEMVKEEEERRG